MKPMIDIVTLGERVGDLTLDGADALRQGKRVILRTAKHPVASWLEEQGIAYESLDHLYEEAEDFDTLTAKVKDAVLEASPCVYGAADPLTDESVRALCRDQAALRLIPGVTQWGRALGDAAVLGHLDEGCLNITALNAESLDFQPGLGLVINEISSRLMASELKTRLLALYPPDMSVVLRDHTGAQEMALEDLDRQKHYDHTTTLYLPPIGLQERQRYVFGDLVKVMDRLRGPDGCPWDREQTHESLREYLLEEACEAIEAIDRGDMDLLADELGDVLLQVVFHAHVDKQHGGFDILDVTTAICQKMIHRHAHIFGDVVCETSADVLKSWEAIKKKDRGFKTQGAVMRDVPRSLPALMRAAKIQKKARDVGFDWADLAAALPKVFEEAQEVAQAAQTGEGLEEELGDLLFAAANAARLAGVQPELVLSAATDKFVRRFEAMEHAILAEGLALQNMTMEEKDAYWDRVKEKEERHG